MTTWKATGWTGTYEAKGRSLRLILEPHPIARDSGWYWKVINEEGTTISSGYGETETQAKRTATQTAKRRVG